MSHKSSSRKYGLNLNNAMRDPCSLLLRLQGLLHKLAARLLGRVELEAVEVVHLLADSLVLQLLSPVGRAPLGHNLIPLERLLQGLLAGAPWDLALEVGKAQPLHRHHVAAHAR